MDPSQKNAKNFDAIFGGMQGEPRKPTFAFFSRLFSISSDGVRSTTIPEEPPYPSTSPATPTPPASAKPSVQPHEVLPAVEPPPAPAWVPAARPIFAPITAAADQDEEPASASPASEEPPLSPEPEPSTALEVLPEPPTSEPEPQPSTWFFTLDGESRQALEGDVVLGRKPSGEGALAIMVSDQTRTMSKTHVRLSPTSEGVLVTDMGSTNGTILTSPAGSALRLSPHAPALAAAGSEVRFGSRTVTISH